ncbi:MAG TPA: acyltransferase [Flavitalea sp.]|nr:acyltransferase [Flavitalea sp.]
MKGFSSVYLDILRLGAALVVLFHHAYDQWFPTHLSTSQQINNGGHAAVVVFFVLSGFVITHTTISNNRGGVQYIQARVSRLCSVVIPALVITAIAQLVVIRFSSDLIDLYSRGNSLPRYILASFFLNELWFFSAAPPINGPLWSLSYEFWYYMIFGLAVYMNRSWRIILPLIACLIAGPKILLMMPIWLTGCFVYILPKPSLKKSFSWCLVLLSLIVASLIVIYLRAIPYHVGSSPFYYSNQFFTDWITGFFIGLSLWLLPNERKNAADSNAVLRFRKIADLTFPIYVLHFPLLIVYRTLCNYQLYNVQQMWLGLTSVLLACTLLGLLMDAQRVLWIRLFKYVLQPNTILGIRLPSLTRP